MIRKIPDKLRPQIERLRWECFLACLTGITANAELPLTDISATEKAMSLSRTAIGQYLSDALDRGTTIEMIAR